MKKTTALAASALLCFLCAALPAQNKTVLVGEKLVNKNSYLIIARGYSQPGQTDRIKSELSAKEAAVLNAQILAKERFVESFDVITNGKKQKFIVYDGYADVYYLLSWPNIKNYLRKK